MILPRDSYHVYTPARAWIASFSSRDDAIAYAQHKVESAWMKRNTGRKKVSAKMLTSLDYVVVSEMKIIWQGTEPKENIDVSQA